VAVVGQGRAHGAPLRARRCRGCPAARAARQLRGVPTSCSVN